MSPPKTSDEAAKRAPCKGGAHVRSTLLRRAGGLAPRRRVRLRRQTGGRARPARNRSRATRSPGRCPNGSESRCAAANKAIASAARRGIEMPRWQCRAPAPDRHERDVERREGRHLREEIRVPGEVHRARSRDDVTDRLHSAREWVAAISVLCPHRLHRDLADPRLIAYGELHHVAQGAAAMNAPAPAAGPSARSAAAWPASGSRDDPDGGGRGGRRRCQPAPIPGIAA